MKRYWYMNSYITTKKRPISDRNIPTGKSSRKFLTKSVGNCIKIYFSIFNNNYGWYSVYIRRKFWRKIPHNCYRLIRSEFFIKTRFDYLTYFLLKPPWPLSFFFPCFLPSLFSLSHSNLPSPPHPTRRCHHQCHSPAMPPRCSSVDDPPLPEIHEKTWAWSIWWWGWTNWIWCVVV